MTTIACVLIVTANRVQLVKEKVLPSVLTKGFDDILWVGDGEAGAGYRFFHVPKIAGTTVDALVKRDVGALATTADFIFYLCDDHALTSFDRDASTFDIFVPTRWCWRDGERQRLNNGTEGGYCAGHAGLFRRSLVVQRPWSTMPHHPNWDLLASLEQANLGATAGTGNAILVEDLEPQTRPWE